MQVASSRSRCLCRRARSRCRQTWSRAGSAACASRRACAPWAVRRCSRRVSDGRWGPGLPLRRPARRGSCWVDSCRRNPRPSQPHGSPQPGAFRQPSPCPGNKPLTPAAPTQSIHPRRRRALLWRRAGRQALARSRRLAQHRRGRRGGRRLPRQHAARPLSRARRGARQRARWRGRRRVGPGAAAAGGPAPGGAAARAAGGFGRRAGRGARRRQQQRAGARLQQAPLSAASCTQTD